MLCTLALLTAIVVCAGCGGRAGPAPLEPALPATAWAEDLQVLARELPRRHANAFHTVSRAEFEGAVAALDAALPRLSQDSIYVGFRRIVAMIGDGHTNLSFPANWPLLPLRFRWFGDAVGDPASLELRVTHATAPYELALGAHLASVADSSAAGAYRALNTIIAGGESEGSSRVASTFFLRSPHVLRGLGIAADVDSVGLTLVDSAGRELSLRVQPLARDTSPEWRRAAARVPLYLTRTNEPFWFVRLADAEGDSSTVYLAFNAYPSYLEFWRHARALFAQIDRSPTRRLVIDLRNNTGGDFNKVRRLLIPGLHRRPNVSAPGHLYVLTGPVTFSAAMTNAADLRRELGAILVGEPTGARPNQYQEGDSFTLPNSRLRVSVSTRYYRFQAEDTPGVLPDHHLAPSWEDWRAGRDPALEWILAQPHDGTDGRSVSTKSPSPASHRASCAAGNRHLQFTTSRREKRSCSFDLHSPQLRQPRF